MSSSEEDLARSSCFVCQDGGMPEYHGPLCGRKSSQGSLQSASDSRSSSLDSSRFPSKDLSSRAMQEAYRGRFGDSSEGLDDSFQEPHTKLEGNMLVHRGSSNPFSDTAAYHGPLHD